MNVVTNFVAGNDVFVILATARVCAMLVYLTLLISF